MAPPFIAVTLEAKRKIPPAARLAQVTEAAFGWGLVCLWEWCWEQKADTATPDHLEAFFGTDGARMVRAMVAFGFAELLDDGTVRVKGADRYLRISEAKAEGGKARAAGAQRDEKGRLTSKNTSSRPAEHQQNTSKKPALSSTIDDRDLPFLPSEGRGRGESASPPAADAAPPEPVERVEGLQSAWNSLTAPPLPRWQETGDKRRKAAKARLRERPLAEWRAIIERIAASDFCRGGNDRGWAAGPDFLLRPDTAAKVLEGTYDNRGRARPGRQADLTAGASAPPEGECVVCGGPGEVGFALGRLCYHDYAIWMDTPVVRASERPYELEGEFKAWLDERRRELEAA